MPKDTSQPQLPPTSAIDNVTNVTFENWFEYPVRAQPHHTDYAGIVWHGTYLTWMEEARVGAGVGAGAAPSRRGVRIPTPTQP